MSATDEKEANIPDDIPVKLARMGHMIKVEEDEPGATDNFAHPTAILIDHERWLLHAGVEALRTATALGY